MKLLIFLAFFSTASSIIIECDFGNYNFEHWPRRVYTCEVSSYSDEGNKIVTAINGKHNDGKTNSDVDGLFLVLGRKNLDYLPTGFENFFPNLNLIVIRFGKIEKLKGDELKNYQNLEFFGVWNTPLEFVGGKLYENNKKLKTIRLDSNKIKQVGSGLFNGLENLRNVFLSGNVCINENANGSTDIESLKENLKLKCSVESEN